MDSSKTHYARELDIRSLVLSSIQVHDAVIQHREKVYLVWILRDLKIVIGYDLKTDKACSKIVILINIQSKKIITHMPVWEYGCANV
jgi:hypothetical protein